MQILVVVTISRLRLEDPWSRTCFGKDFSSTAIVRELTGPKFPANCLSGGTGY